MGAGIAANLARASYDVLGYDLKPTACAHLDEAGGRTAESSEQVVAESDIVLSCVEGRDAIALADAVLLPNARPGQVFIDHSTVPAPQTRRIGQAMLERGAQYLDAPISGGWQGAAAGTLRVFVGGDRATAARCWPLFEVIGNPDKVVYCGAIGQGQVAKVVQQLTRRFPDVARLEVMCFGLRAGLDAETLARALDVELDSDSPYARLLRGLQSGDIERFSFEYAEWAYYLEEARAQGFRLPMLEAMYEFCLDAAKTTVDALARPEPSIWNELMGEEREIN
jgi:3-hydroxyisobutyrate dehydrogenase-like beta-hydroxyacid dehydrogenase